MRSYKTGIRRVWQEIRWIVIGIAWLISLILGYIGFSQQQMDSGLPIPVTERIYRTIQLISLESGNIERNQNWQLEVARFLLPGLTAFTAFQALAILFREQTQWFKLWRLKDHNIICGFGSKGSHLVNDCLSNGHQLVIIDKNIDAITANDYRQRGLIVLAGDATDPETLLSARITKAKRLICLLGQDQQNLRIAHLAYQLSKDRQRKLTCITHLASQDLLNLVKRSELTFSSNDPFILETFNTYHQAANQIIQQDPGWLAEDSSLPDNILVVGLGRLGQNLVLRSGYKWFSLEKEKKLIISILDSEAEQKVKNLTKRQPELENCVSFQPITVSLEVQPVLKEATGALEGLERISRVYICVSDPVLSLQTYQTLREIPTLSQIHFVVRVEKGSGLADLYKTPITGFSKEGEIHLFDLFDETCSAELVMGGLNELLARLLRENYLQSQKTSEASKLLSISWDQVPNAEKEANRQQANRICRLLEACNYRINPLQNWDARNLRFSDQEVKNMAQLEHQLWCQWKHASGWRYGPVRDNQLKTNPDLVLWEDLPPEEQQKNNDFIIALPRLLADMGFQIDRQLNTSGKTC